VNHVRSAAAIPLGALRNDTQLQALNEGFWNKLPNSRDRNVRANPLDLRQSHSRDLQILRKEGVGFELSCLQWIR
jgi:hypothetical protein